MLEFSCTHPAFPPELWEQTPRAVRAYISALEARVAALEATVQPLLERLQQDARHSSRPPAREPPQALGQRVRERSRTPAPCRVTMRPIRRAVARWLTAGQTCGVAKTAGVCREVRKVYDALWTFGRIAGGEPTTKGAERAIRPGVLWRPGRFGTQRAQGALGVETLMTVVATRTQQHREVLAYRPAAGQAAYTGMPAPSLLPRHTEAEEALPIAA